MKHKPKVDLDDLQTSLWALVSRNKYNPRDSQQTARIRKYRREILNLAVVVIQDIRLSGEEQ